MNAALNLGPHADFIVASYVAAGVIVLAVLVWVALDYRTQRGALKDLETKGVKRRSAKKP